MAASSMYRQHSLNPTIETQLGIQPSSNPNQAEVSPPRKIVKKTIKRIVKIKKRNVDVKQPKETEEDVPPKSPSSNGSFMYI